MAVCFSGHRPGKLPGGYNYYSPQNIELGRRLRKEVIEQIKKGQKHFICGGALGIDQIAFMVCKKLRDQGYDIIIEVAVPFKNQPIKWNMESQELYKQQLLAADIITYVDTLDMYRTNIPDGFFDKDKLINRNKYMIDNSDVLIAVWDGSPSGTKHAINYAKEKNKEVIIVNI